MYLYLKIKELKVGVTAYSLPLVNHNDTTQSSGSMSLCMQKRAKSALSPLYWTQDE